MSIERIRLAAAAGLLAMIGCREAPPAVPINNAGAPEPMPHAEDLLEGAEMANQAAEAEARDAELGGHNSGASSNLQ